MLAGKSGVGIEGKGPFSWGVTQKGECPLVGVRVGEKGKWGGGFFPGWGGGGREGKGG